MNQIWRGLILAGVAVISAGCKTDQGTRHAEQMDARVSDSRPETSYPAPATPAPVDSTAGLKPSGAVTLSVEADTRPRVVCFGDSLTAGYGADPGQSYPDFLQAALDKRGYKYRVVNEGVSGNTTKDGAERVDDVIRLKPAVVVVEFGGNDGLRGLRIEDSRASLDTILQKLTASGTRVVLAGITLPPDYGPDYIQQFNQTYVLLAKKYKVPMLPFLLKGVFGVPGMMQRDSTHATDAGNRIVAENVVPLVTPLLHR